MPRTKFNSDEERKEANKIRKKEFNTKLLINGYFKEYYLQHKEELTSKIICDCGTSYDKSHKSRHFKTQNHINKMIRV